MLICVQVHVPETPIFPLISSIAAKPVVLDTPKQCNQTQGTPNGGERELGRTQKRNLKRKHNRQMKAEERKKAARVREGEHKALHKALQDERKKTERLNKDLISNLNRRVSKNTELQEKQEKFIVSCKKTIADQERELEANDKEIDAINADRDAHAQKSINLQHLHHSYNYFEEMVTLTRNQILDMVIPE